MSSSVGSLVLASFCAASRMNFCLFIASSSARILLAPDEQRHHHVREDDDVPQRQERHAEPARLRRRLARIPFLVPEKHSSPVRYAVSAAFWKRMMGCSLLVTTSSEIRTSLMFGCDGM